MKRWPNINDISWKTYHGEAKRESGKKILNLYDTNLVHNPSSSTCFFQMKFCRNFIFTHILLHWYSLGLKPSKDSFQGLTLHCQDDLLPKGYKVTATHCHYKCTSLLNPLAKCIYTKTSSKIAN